ncbi:MAG TPA: GntR family transcriptional regulator [Gaiellales bacterium]|nr:GntR family transcriptional regulator [Gaiellales bacterium]
MPTRSPGGPSRADELAHQLQVEIITGEIPLGTRLNQEDMAARFGVSRTPIREALRQLQAIGLVEQLGHRGALVRSFSPDECRNVFLVRAELEGLAAQRAAGRLTTFDHADLRTAQSLLTSGFERHGRLAPGDADRRTIICEQWSQANELFHNVILAAANCPPLRATVQSLANHVPRSLAWHTFGDDPGIIPRSVEDHELILEALDRPDPRRARRLLHAHVIDTGETLARWLERHAR